MSSRDRIDDRAPPRGRPTRAGRTAIDTRLFARSLASCDMMSPFCSGGRLWLRCGRFDSVAGLRLMDERFLIADIRSVCGSDGGAAAGGGRRPAGWSAAGASSSAFVWARAREYRPTVSRGAGGLIP